MTRASFVMRGDIGYSAGPDRLRTIADGYLVCAEGHSAGAFEALPEAYADWPMLDFRGKLILPGLVDLHMHAPQYTYRALGMDRELIDWLNTYTFPEEARYSDLDYARATYGIVAAELRRGPNTRTALFATAHSQATDVLMRMMDGTGLVSFVGRVNMDRNAPDSLREPDAATSLEQTREWIERTQSAYKNTKPILTPRFIPSCSDELMGGLAALQADFALPIQSHLSENKAEIAWVQQLCPDSDSYTDAYHRFGMMRGLPTIMAHCVWCDEDEQALIEASGTFVAHCPQSNINIASGIAPIRRYLRKGIRVGLGSDVAGGAHPSIFRAMVDAIAVSKLWWRLVDENDEPLTLAEAFYLGTAGGGEFFGKVGSFAPGYEFDALVLDDSTIPTVMELTVEDRLARAVHLSDDRHIVGKIVRGQRLF